MEYTRVRIQSNISSRSKKEGQGECGEKIVIVKEDESENKFF